MSMLVILLPERRPLAEGAPVEAAPTEWPYLLSPDNQAVSRQGNAPMNLLPRADTLVAVVPPGLISWHRVPLPKAPTNRLRAALGGVMEEQLLDDDDAVHLAIGPRPAAGQPAWVAVVHKPWLAAQMNALQSAGLTVDRLVPAQAPTLGADAPPLVHFYRPPQDDSGCWVCASDAEGVSCLPLAGSLARMQLPRWQAAGARFTTTPAAATVAERWLGAPIAMVTDTDMALAAANSDWNLLQFDLVPNRRGTRALLQWGKRWLGPAWRPARWGLAALALVQVAGLNLWAWHQQRAINDKRESLASLLKTAHPQVRAVLDAPLQMRRETEQLRLAAGVPADGDLEPMLAAAAAAWPEGQPPAAQVNFEPGRLTLAAAGWGPPQIAQLKQRLQATGWAVDSADGKLTISRAARQSGT